MNNSQSSRSLHVKRFLAGAIGGLTMSTLGLVSVLLGVLGCLTGFALGWFAVDACHYSWADLFARCRVRLTRSESRTPRGIKQVWRDFWTVERQHNTVRKTGAVAMLAFVLVATTGIVCAIIMSGIDFADIMTSLEHLDYTTSRFWGATIFVLVVIAASYAFIATVVTLTYLVAMSCNPLDNMAFESMRNRRIKDLETLGTARFTIGYWRRCGFLIVGTYLMVIVANIVFPFAFMLMLFVYSVGACGLAMVSGVRTLLDPKRNIIMSVLATLCGGAASLLWLMPRLEGSFAVVMGACLTGVACGALSMTAPLLARVKELPSVLQRIHNACEDSFNHPWITVDTMTKFTDKPVESVIDGYIKRFDLGYLA